MRAMQEQQHQAGEEALARVVWAAHILSYLIASHSQDNLVPSAHINQQDDGGEGDDFDEEQHDHDDHDLDSTAPDTLASSDEAIRIKFLNCVAELFVSYERLEPCHGDRASREGEPG